MVMTFYGWSSAVSHRGALRVCVVGVEGFCSIAAQMKACLYAEAQRVCDDGHVIAQAPLM